MKLGWTKHLCLSSTLCDSTAVNEMLIFHNALLVSHHKNLLSIQNVHNGKGYAIRDSLSQEEF